MLGFISHVHLLEPSTIPLIGLVGGEPSKNHGDVLLFNFTLITNRLKQMKIWYSSGNFKNLHFETFDQIQPDIYIIYVYIYIFVAG